MRVLASTLLVIATIHATKACTAGESRESGSDTCFCMADGLSWNCVPAERKCVPGTTFTKDCHVCDCLKDGLVNNAFCTRVPCDSHKWIEDDTPKFAEEGHTFDQSADYDVRDSKDNSNVRYFYPYPMHFIQKLQRCKLGEFFKVYCNYCVCELRDSTAQPRCTNMVCDLSIWNKDGTMKSDVLVNTEGSI